MDPSVFALLTLEFRRVEYDVLIPRFLSNSLAKFLVGDAPLFGDAAFEPLIEPNDVSVMLYGLPIPELGDGGIGDGLLLSSIIHSSTRANTPVSPEVLVRFVGGAFERIKFGLRLISSLLGGFIPFTSYP
jgi:hypothetical protein